MKPLIAIVGRPNVGKSTLFNYLTRSRNALVVDQPGITRDHHYGLASHQKRGYTVVDTGGLDDLHDDPEHLGNLITTRSLAMAETADALIWMVDGREGLTPADERIAGTLRPRCDQIIVCVNKTEGLDPVLSSSEFYSLGFATVAISAARGTNIYQLMEAVFDGLPSTMDDDAPTTSAEQRIVLLGRPNVGKSTLINAIVGQQRMLTSRQPGTTRDSIAVPYKRNATSYTLVDTAGIRRRAKIRDPVEKFSVVKSLQAIDYARIVIQVLDAHEAITEQDANLLGMIAARGKAVILAINKWDELEHHHKKIIKRELQRRLGFVDYACVHFISALHGSGVGDLFHSINAIEQSIATKPVASKLTAILQQAVATHPPPIIRGRRIKLRYAHLGSSNPFLIIVHGNQTNALPESYRRYLSRQIRTRLKLVGVPVLLEFRQGNNPYRHKKNTLTRRQAIKRQRLIHHVKRR